MVNGLWGADNLFHYANLTASIWLDQVKKQK